jgi:HYDIN/CFA65/VesB family protein/ASPM-SPD-2-Hydin domain-containing protein
MVTESGVNEVPSGGIETAASQGAFAGSRAASALFCGALFLLAALPGRASPSNVDPRVGHLAGEGRVRVPIHFEQNEGQIDPQVRFLARADGYRLFLTARGAVIELTKAARRDEFRFGGRSPNREFPRDSRRPRARESAVVSIMFDGASANPAVEGVDPIAAHVSYFVGSDPKRWHTSIPIFARVRYRGVWPGIDLVYYGNEDSIEYDLIVAPGANPDAIRLRVDGAAARIDSAGDVVLETAAGNLRLLRPRIYQDGAGGARRAVQGRFVATSPANRAATQTQTLSVRVADYDRSRALVIDPQLVYSTYLGGSGGRANSGAVGDEATEIAIDSSNNIYVTGFAYSTDFPITVGPPNAGTSNESSVAFVAKLNPAASGAASLIYATYLGGSGFRDASNPAAITIDGDEGLGIAVDASGDAYITGFTFSDDFPTTPGAFQTKNPHSAPGIGTAFVTELDPTGANLLYSTFLGGSNGDFASRLALSPGCSPPQCEAYVAGATMSADFPTHNPFQAVFPEPQDRSAAFVTVLAGDGGSLVYSTFLGGTDGPDLGGDGALGIAADSSGNAYVTGFSGSSDFPTVGAFQKSNKALGTNGQNAFVAKLNPFADGGASLVYSTYLGGRGSINTTGDFGVSIDVDAMGRAFLTGVAGSEDFPIKRAFQSVNRAAANGGLTNAFVSELASDGSKLLYSTFLGGSSFIGDSGVDLVVNAEDHVFVTGASASRDFPTTANACQTKSRGALKNLSLNAFITELNPEASSRAEQLAFSTYFGGRSMDAATGIAADPSGLIYVDGIAFSPDLPITSATAFQTSQMAFANGQPNAFIAVIDPSSGCPRIVVTPRSINFGRVGIGAVAASHEVAIRNVGKDPLQVTVSGLSAPFRVADAGVFTVDPHSKKKLKVFFEPISTLVTTNGQLMITSDDPQHPSAAINLKGRGEPGSLSLPKSLRFGQVRRGRSKSLTLQIRNTGLGLLTGTVNISGVTSPFTASGQLSFSLASGKSQALSVAFEPKTASGPIFQTIEVSSDDPDHPVAIVLLVGTGT